MGEGTTHKPVAASAIKNAAELSKWLQQALDTHQRGQLEAAAAQYQQLLLVAPECADAHHLLGLCLLQQGDEAAAVVRLRRATELVPRIPEFFADLAAGEAALGNWLAARAALERASAGGVQSAERLHSLGLARLRELRSEDAIACFELECRCVPRAAAHHNLAIALLQRDRVTEAETALNRAIQLKPDFVSAYKNRALLYERYGKFELALGDWTKCCALEPAEASVYAGLARAQMALNRISDATATLTKATQQFPDQPTLWNALGVARQQNGDLDAAVLCFGKVCQLLPQSAESHANLGSAYASLKQWDAAVASISTAIQLDNRNPLLFRRLATCLTEVSRLGEAEQALLQAIKLEPRDADSHIQLGDVIQQTGDFERAIPSFQGAAELEPSRALAYAKLGLAAKRIGDADTARNAFQKLGEIEGTDEARYLRTMSLPVIYRDGDDLVTRRQQLEFEVDSMLAAGVRLKSDKMVLNTTFLIAYHGYNDCEIQKKVARLWEVEDYWTTSNRRSTRSNRLRIGFLSSLLKYHTVGKLTRGWIKELDRKRFEVIVLSPYDHEDQGAEWIRSAADHYFCLSHELPAAAKRVLEQQLDVLIYPEVGMDPLTVSLARMRLAPVQCAMWGHPVTTGLPHMDYFLSSHLIEPNDAQEHYSETLIQLSTLPTYYYLPRAPNSEKDRGDFGLATDANVYLCPHSFFKMHPDFDALLRSILIHDRRGRIVLIEGRYRRWRDELNQRFERTLAGVHDRVHFLPVQAHADYMRLLELSDVLLDAPHFGGGNTHYEAFSLGLPIVTKPSAFMRGRVAYGLYQKMGIDDCIADNDAHYVELALQIANDKQRSRTLRQKILDRKHLIYEDHGSVRELEDFLGEVQQPPAVVPKTNARFKESHGRPAQTTHARNLATQLRPCTCPACGHHVAVPFFNPGALPLATLAWPADAAEALVMKRLPHDFLRCVDCGHVYNAAFEYAEVPYSTKPNLMFNRGALWQEHLRKVRELLLADLPERPTVVEIGCGEGHLLRALAAERPDGKYIGFDPNARVDTQGKFQARAELFDPAVHLGQCRPDLLISRHVLEHLMNPNGFIQALAFAVSCTGHATRLFIEVPCIDHVFRLSRTVDFFYEHHSHFTTTSLDRMLRRSASEVSAVGTSYSGEVAYALAQFQPREQQVRFAQEAVDFAERAAQNKERIRQQLDTLYRSGRRIAIWGGTGKAAAFIQQHGIDRNRFPLVVDSDVEKAGTYVPGAGQRIEFRDRLLSDPVDVIVIATHWRAADIVLEILRCGIRFETILLEHEGRLVDYFRDDHPYHAPHNQRTVPHGKAPKGRKGQQGLLLGVERKRSG